MLKIFENANYLFLVSTGSILGVISRLLILDYFELRFNRKELGLVIINLLATFIFGFTFSIFFENGLINSLWLIFFVGFLGSFSTFSSFILDLLSQSLQNKWRELFLILSVNILGGVLLAFLGFKLGKV
tara:strand:+ start:128 stop:514 length:387 start_codon:yes stop_codon:yes gene_type:complete